MENKVFKLLEQQLNFDCAMLINSYYADLLRKDLIKTFRLLYPTEIEVWKHVNFDGSIVTMNSRATMHNPVTNVRIASIRSCAWYNRQRGIYHLNQNIEKFLYINGKQYRVATPFLTKLNARSFVLCYAEHEKAYLLDQCKECGIKAYKSWTKTKLIQALLKV